MADRVTIADVAAAADTALADAFPAPPWNVHPGGPPDFAAGGQVWAEVTGCLPAINPARAEAVTVRCIAVVRSRTNVPERVDQLDALDRFVVLAAGWPACTRHVCTVETIRVGGVDTPAVVAALTVIASPC